MHILVIFTGGTIGSTLSDGWISPDTTAKYTLINTYKTTHTDAVTFSTRTPYTILSENVSAENLTTLTNEICRATNENFDGIIVTHGTDTLQYTAAALAYATGNDCIPVVLVSSNYPLTDPRANGNDNFAAAVAFIQQQCGKGVFVAYKNESQPVHFHNALSVLSHLEGDDKVYSWKDNLYAVATDKGIAVVGENAPCKTLSAVFSETAPVLVVDPHPADNYAYPLNHYRAVLLRPYHSGTLPTASPAFTTFCKRVKTADIPLFVADITPGDAYESAKQFPALGITPLYNTTFIAAFIKLWMEYSE